MDAGSVGHGLLRLFVPQRRLLLRRIEPGPTFCYNPLTGLLCEMVDLGR